MSFDEDRFSQSLQAFGARGADLSAAVTPRLVVFARFPEAGACKTRLIAAIGPERAANVHRQLTERTVQVLKASGNAVTVAATGAPLSSFRLWLGSTVDLVEQVEGDLTAKLMAFLDPSPVVFFGADTPDLAPHHVKAALAGLKTHDVVIGPAEDGGYYLIGMRTPLPELLIDMPWSTEHVMLETLARLARLAIEPLLLETLADCDRPEDLARWPQLLQ
jgi:uncharacterized protein